MRKQMSKEDGKSEKEMVECGGMLVTAESAEQHRLLSTTVQSNGFQYFDKSSSGVSEPRIAQKSSFFIITMSNRGENFFPVLHAYLNSLGTSEHFAHTHRG